MQFLEFLQTRITLCVKLNIILNRDTKRENDQIALKPWITSVQVSSRLSGAKIRTQ